MHKKKITCVTNAADRSILSHNLFLLLADRSPPHSSAQHTSQAHFSLTSSPVLHPHVASRSSRSVPSQTLPGGSISLQALSAVTEWSLVPDPVWKEKLSATPLTGYIHSRSAISPHKNIWVLFCKLSYLFWSSFTFSTSLCNDVIWKQKTLNYTMKTQMSTHKTE